MKITPKMTDKTLSEPVKLEVAHEFSNMWSNYRHVSWNNAAFDTNKQNDNGFESDDYIAQLYRMSITRNER